MFSLTELKKLVVERIDLEELVCFAAQARALRAEFDYRNVEVPAWLDEVQRKLGREINGRISDARANILRSIDAELDRLKTPTEKRTELLEKRNRLLASVEG